MIWPWRKKKRDVPLAHTIKLANEDAVRGNSFVTVRCEQCLILPSGAAVMMRDGKALRIYGPGAWEHITPEFHEAYRGTLDDEVFDASV